MTLISCQIRKYHHPCTFLPCCLMIMHPHSYLFSNKHSSCICVILSLLFFFCLFSLICLFFISQWSFIQHLHFWCSKGNLIFTASLYPSFTHCSYSDSVLRLYQLLGFYTFLIIQYSIEISFLLSVIYLNSSSSMPFRCIYNFGLVIWFT